jgi:hypothetical protein
MENTENEKKCNIPVVSCNLLGYFIVEDLMDGHYKKWMITEIDNYGRITGTDINEFGNIQKIFIHRNSERVKEVVMLNCD